MSNTFADGTRREEWIPNVQADLDKALVSKALCDMYTGPARLIHNPYNSTPAGADGSATTSYSVTDFESTDDTYTVDRRAVAAEHVDNIEQLQTSYDLASQRATRHSYVIRDRIDQYILNLPVGTSGVRDIDAGDFAGSDGSPYASSSTVIDDIANTIILNASLNSGALDRGMFWVVSPYELQDMTSFMQNNGFNVADAAIKNGYMGQPFAGLDVYLSNNLTHTVSLGLATNPTDGDPLVISVPGINGRRDITITFVAALSTGPTVAGEVHIASTVDITRANLEEFLDAFGASSEAEAADTGYTALADEDVAALKAVQIATTNDNSANTLAVTVKGTLTVSETLTDATDTWGSVSRHTIAGVKKSIQLALPSGGMEFEKKAVSGKHGREIVTSQIYKGHIWQNNKPEVFDVVLS